MSLIHYKKYNDIALFSRNLRKNPTSSEKVLWEVLRRKSLFGFKFLRQHPVFYRIDKDWVEFYVADFYCSKLKLIIEVDGIIHEYQKEHDSERDSILISKGIQVIRIRNEELEDIGSVIDSIKSIVRNRIVQITENKHST